MVIKSDILKYMQTLQEFINKWNGKYCEIAGSPSAANQCVDLANQWIRDGLGLPIIEWTNAVDFPKKASNKDYQYILNTPTGVPVAGDLIIWGGNVGHIAIFVEGDTNSFKSFDQNYPTGSVCKIVTHNYNNVIGWLHPIKNMTITDDALKACLLDREKFWKERDEYKAKYETAIDDNTKLKNSFNQYQSEAEATLASLKRDKEASANEAKEYKQANYEILRDLAEKLGTTQQKAQIVTEVIKLIDIEDEGKKAIDDLRIEKLQRKTVETELNNEIAKLKTQLTTKDLTEHDFETLLKALIQKIVKIIKDK
jgi:hypothetical protein